jgi:hypothetical protein
MPRFAPLARLRTLFALTLCFATVSKADTQPHVSAADLELLQLGKQSSSRFLATLPKPESLPKLGFDVREADFYPEIKRALRLLPEEEQSLKERAFAVVDHDQRYTFASAYLGVYTRDLPVLITTDSILHAWHRSYDTILRSLEEQLLAPRLTGLLTAMHGTLSGRAQSKTRHDARTRADAELYLRGALALLAGPEHGDRARLLAIETGEDDTLAALVAAAEKGEGHQTVRLRGAERELDFSQFAPRGHYTKNEALGRYFRTLMWLGRSDLGFWISEGDARLTTRADVPRERAAAALLIDLLEEAKQRDSFLALDELIDQLAGKADGLTPRSVWAERERQRAAGKPVDSLSVLQAAVGQGQAAQRIQSAYLMVDRKGPRAELPGLFQLFGQRFSLDSYVLSEVVHDRLNFDGRTVPRMLPSTLDVMAALGNDEAARLLTPEFERWAYAPKLAALRGEVVGLPAARWQQDLHSGWLGVLRTLQSTGSEERLLPSTMRGTSWRRKMLATELASWSELRHDNVLYTKESYTMSISCEYPSGYVEPYPAFYRSMAALAQRTQRALLKYTGTPAASDYLGDSIDAFLASFQDTTSKLAEIADRELANESLTRAQKNMLKQVIFNRVVGCGSVETDGWYAKLYYGDAMLWEPSISALHTDSESDRILHAGVGDAHYMVWVLDSEGDRQAFVGPVYSYYETVTDGTRLNDETWQERIQGGQRGTVPEWLAPLRGPRRKRELGPAARSAFVQE